MDQMFIETIRKDFPILNVKVRNGVPLIYLDNAATTQKPKQVVDAISDYYLSFNANVHRGIHALSEIASEKYEEAHLKVAQFLNSKFSEVIFTKNTTEGLNLVAHGLEPMLKKGDEIVVTRMEHHSNLVPFQIAAKRTGATLKFIELESFETLDMHSAEKVITDKTKLVSVPHMSNVLGTVNPVKEINDIAKEHGALMLVDGAQSVPHLKVDFKKLGIDFLSFSGHKMLAPMGIGGLIGKEEVLMEFEPLLYGGEMIRHVDYENATWNDLPWKFEAGTPNVGGGLGLAAAVDYLQNIGMERVHQIEYELTKYTLERFEELDFLKVYGPPAEKRGGVVSFNVYNDAGQLIHPHDVSTLLDENGIAIRAGHHCAQPLMKAMQIPATNRVSFYIYNTFEDIDKTIEVLKQIKEIFN